MHKSKFYGEYKMNELLLKRIAFLSLILGVVMGVITVIPFISSLSFLALMVLASVIVIIYMKKKNFIGYIDPKEGSIFGAIIGFISFIGFCLSFLPLASIIGLIYKGSFYIGVSLIVRAGLFVIILMVLFVAMLSALINAFSGLVTAYIYTQIEPKPEEQKTNIEFEE